MNTKKLVILAPSFYPNNGGVEKHLEKVVDRLSKRGINVTILVRYSKSYPKFQRAYGANIIRMPKKLNIISMKYWLLKNKKIFNGAVVHSHDYFPFNLRKILPNIRWVHTFHGYEGYPLHEEAIESRRRLHGLVDYSFCVGQFIEKWYGTKCDNILWGAADQVAIKNIKSKWDFIFYGRYEDDTGIEYYVKAFKKISAVRPESKMIAVGWGSLEERIKKYSRENNLSIEFHKPVRDISSLLSQSRVAFVSGYLSIIESALQKKPIVSYWNTPIKRDYLATHPLAEYLNISKSSDQIAKYALASLSPNSFHINKSFEWAKKQTWDYIADQYEKAYQW